MNRFSDKTIQRAFEIFEQVFDQGWQLRHKNELYRSADRAFSDGGDCDEFKKVYDELIRTWGLGRKGQLVPAPKAFGILRALPNCLEEKFKMKRLTSFAADDIPDLAELLPVIAGIKKLKNGPSLMAISKLLHFWNPRFFVIFDRAVMEKFVFEHNWLKVRFERMAREIIGDDLPKAFAKAFSKYIAALRVCSECLKSNPAIGKYFFEYCCRQLEDAEHPRDLRDYDALAVESFLEGAVHLPPRC